MKMSMPIGVGRAGLISAWCAALCGCLGTSPPSRFYLLTPTVAASVEAAAAQAGGKSVFLAAVELPKHLLDPRIVTRVGENELDFAEFERWGEPLQDNFARILAKNIALLRPDCQVATFLWERPGEVDFLVAVVVTRFDAQDGSVVLEARWTVTRGGLESTPTFEQSAYVRPVKGGGYGATVRAMSEALAALSGDVCAAIGSR